MAESVRAFHHPGRAFLRIHGPVQELADVYAYAGYLRREAGLKPDTPVDLGAIYDHFGIPTPRQAPLPNQQGLLLNPETGLIIINENDIAARQRFTVAHELMELLFDALPQGRGWAIGQKGPFSRHVKEKLCDRGAAQLLMPESEILRVGTKRGVSFQTAHALADRFGVSTTAALVQLVRLSPHAHSLVMWNWMLKKGEQPPAGQLALFDSPPENQPQKKLRVQWAFRAAGSPHIPKNKSIPEHTSIYAAFQSGRFSAKEETLDLGSVQGRFTTENWPFQAGPGRRVLSLLEYLS